MDEARDVVPVALPQFLKTLLNALLVGEVAVDQVVILLQRRRVVVVESYKLVFVVQFADNRLADEAVAAGIV